MNSQPCDFCKETNCVASGKYPISDDSYSFVAVRMDMEFNQIDAEFGILDKDGNCIAADWSSALDIRYCPICGRLLPKASYM